MPNSADAKTRCLVLIAKNEAIIGLNIQDEREDVGYAVAGPFSTCAEASAWLKANTPDVAVLDIHLRDGACVELAEELTHLGVPFAVYSGELEADTLPAFKGATWVEKPARAATLIDAVAELLAPKAQADPKLPHPPRHANCCY